jgi:16S rRNA pseudouridine516 synthase
MEQVDQHHLRLSIAEGKYHQVKRMFAALGNHVVSLHRSQVGAIVLDAELEPGDYRPLTDAEVASIQ